MNPLETTQARALRTLALALGNEGAAQTALDALEQAGFRMADAQRDELVTRWVDVHERPVPPAADTIIRTITRTNAAGQTSTTHWLDGLRGPNV